MQARPYKKAKIKWPVEIMTDGRSIDAVTLTMNPNEVFISCPSPLRLNSVFAMKIIVPQSKQTITAEAEVIWSNIYGPDDEITPRGMLGRFLNISSQDRRTIAKAALQQLEDDKVDPNLLQSLKTLVIDVGKTRPANSPA